MNPLVWIATTTLALCVFLGCTSTDEPRETRAPSPMSSSGELSSWSRVYTVPATGTVRERVHRGYVQHRITQRDPAGRHEILDLDRRRLGVFLPNGRIFLYEDEVTGEPQLRDLGVGNLDIAVLKILRSRYSELRGVGLVVEYRNIREG